MMWLLNTNSQFVLSQDNPTTDLAAAPLWCNNSHRFLLLWLGELFTACCSKPQHLFPAPASGES